MAIPFPYNIRNYHKFMADGAGERAAYLLSREGFWLLTEFSCQFDEVYFQMLNPVDLEPIGFAKMTQNSSRNFRPGTVQQSYKI